jgi:hypothetical protein
MLDALTDSSFSPHVGTACRLFTAPGAAPIELTISEVQLFKWGAPERRAPFSVFFHGPAGPPLPQGIHHLEHDQLGTLDLFLVPIGPDAQGQRYEATFT